MPDQTSNAYRDADWSESDELIVATEHLGFVLDLIDSQSRVIAENRLLGLTRLRISTADAVEHLREEIASTPGAEDVRVALLRQSDAVSATATSQPDEEDRVAAVATDLRAIAVARHGGWMPTIGRNRTVVFPGSGALTTTGQTSYGVGATGQTSYGVGATGQTSYGGGGFPRPLTAADAWRPPPARATGPGRGVRVGMVDTRLWAHPWLAGGWVAPPSSVLPDGAAPGEVAGHATFVAGLISSLAPGATIVHRVGLDSRGQGTAWNAAEAIVELAQTGVSVINLSFSCYTGDGQPPLTLARAIDRVNSDIVVVAAAGNHAALGQGQGASSELAKFAALPSWPAALDDVLAVGALDQDGNPADFSPERPWVDVAARGVDLRSTFPARVASGPYTVSFGAGWAEWSGTSFSAALVSGAIAGGIDSGRFSALDAMDELLAPGTAGTRPTGTPRRLNLRIAGWARVGKP